MQRKIDWNFAFILCSSRAESIGVNLNPNLPHIKNILENPDHPIVIGRVRKSPVDSRMVFGIHAPVYNNGKFDGTLGSAIYLDRIKSVYLKEIIDLPSSRVYLKDDNGDMLYKSNQNIEYGANDTYLSYNIEISTGRYWELISIIDNESLISGYGKQADLDQKMTIGSRVLSALILTMITGSVVIIAYIIKTSDKS